MIPNKKKRNLRVEDFAVHHAAVATPHRSPRNPPQRVGDGVLDQPLAVQIEPQNASGELAHVEVLEVDQKEPHHQEVPGNHRPADACASGLPTSSTVRRAVQLAHVVHVVRQELRQQHARAAQHVDDLRVQIEIADGLEAAARLSLGFPRGLVALKLLLVDEHGLLVDLARVDHVPAEQTGVRRLVAAAEQPLLDALAAALVDQIDDAVHVGELQRGELALAVAVGEAAGEGVVERVEVVADDVVDVHRRVGVLRVVVVVVDVVEVVVVVAELVRSRRRRGHVVVEHDLVRPQHERRRDVRHHRCLSSAPRPYF